MYRMDRDLAKYRFNTHFIMRRYRYWFVLDLWTEAELRAAWGDR